MKKNNLIKVLKLYFSYHINYLSIITLSVVLLIWVIVLLLNSMFSASDFEYQLNSLAIENNYFKQSIFFMQIINTVLVSFVVSSQISNIYQFDSMFVTNVKRSTIVYGKLIINSIILFIVIIFEILLMFFIASISFSKYIFEINSLILIIYIFIPLFEFILFSQLLLVILPSHFISVLIFIISILLTILNQNSELKEQIYLIFPYLDFQGINDFKLKINIYTYVLISSIFLTINNIIFEKRDLK